MEEFFAICLFFSILFIFFDIFFTFVNRLPWADLVKPAATLARNFTVQLLLEEAISDESANILADPGMAEVYAPNGVFLKVCLLLACL